ncbi:MAG: hypothetical protein QOG43_2222, partial [Actinomycetota bacterium]|nr:hypothetical protein [Actinomycetota bacterium]
GPGPGPPADDRRDKLSPAQRKLLELRLSRSGGTRSRDGAGPGPLGPRPAGTAPGLSSAQRRLWLIDRILGAGAAYNTVRVQRVSGSPDLPALQAALDGVVARHEALRTRFVDRGGSPGGIVSEGARVAFSVVDVREELDPVAAAYRVMRDEAAKRFDLSADVLLRARLVQVADDVHYLIFVTHHVASDEGSRGVLYTELGELYDAHVSGRPPELPPLPLQYGDYALWQDRSLQGGVLQEQLAYWRQRLADLPEAFELPADRPRPPAQSFRGARHPVLLGEELSTALEELSRAEGRTLFTTLLAAFVALLHRYTGEDDVVVGTPVSARSHTELQGLIGFFTNTLVLRTDASGDPTFADLVERTHQTAVAAYAHQDLPFERLVEELRPDRDLTRNPLFQVLVNYVGDSIEAVLDLPGVSTEAVDFDPGTTKFDLGLLMAKRQGRIRLVFEYATDLFDAERIERMASHFTRLLEAAVADPARRLSELDLLSGEEARQLAVAWNDTATGPLPATGLHQLVEASVDRTPDAVALEDGARRLTYAGLEVASNRLAHHLAAVGVAPGQLVGLCAERGVDLVVAVVGILKAGAAYVPLDPDYPPERLAFMRDDAALAAVVGHAAHLGALGGDCPRVGLDTDAAAIAAAPAHRPNLPSDASDLAYVLYTSGSTGRPKGVMLEHRGAIRLVEWALGQYSAEDLATAAATTSESFDLSVFEMFVPLAARGTVRVLADALALTEEGAGEGLTLLNTVPSALTELLALGALPPSLRVVNLAGEALRGDLVRRAYAAGIPRLVNLYGPTEDTTYSTFAVVGVNDDPPPIGRPIANTSCWVLDPHRRMVPVGVGGELYLGGDGLARGYLGRPELTAERFVTVDGRRLYRTGDLVRYRPDSTLEYLGRIDHQVKLRGYRIEMGEIEAALARHPEVREAVAMVREDVPGDKRLAAYVVLETGVDGEEVVGAVHRQVEEWQGVWERTFAVETAPDPTFDIRGWDSSYTGEPIPPEEMREWVEATASRLGAFGPDRVMDVGCGTGLLLWRVAPRCQAYVGTDFSRPALDSLARHVRAAGLPQVRLLHRPADDFSGIDPRSFDAVVLNSVVQYFPNADYLSQVVAGATEVVADGGVIFLGDVRSLPLLEAQHLSIELARSTITTPTKPLRQRVVAAIGLETELTLSPAYFLGLPERLNRIGHVQVMPKRGRYGTEMNRFRYDVILHVGPSVPLPAPEWRSWDLDVRSVERLRELLRTETATVAVTGIPNARVQRDVRAWQLLRSDETPATVGDLVAATTSATDVDPETLWELADGLGWTAELSAATTGQDRVDAVFAPGRADAGRPLASFPRPTPASRERLANDPLQAGLARERAHRLAPELQAFLGGMLPEYMVPNAIVLLDALPLTPNGKLDRKALPPASGRVTAATEFVAPRTDVEQRLADLWTELLGTGPIGADDDFFQLGGHSLSAARLISRIEATFGTRLPLRTIFDTPTVAALAALLEDTTAGGSRAPSADLAARTVERAAPGAGDSDGAGAGAGAGETESPLSFGQQRLWFLDQLEPSSALYNLRLVRRVEGPVDAGLLQGALSDLVARHGTLRTAFAVRGEDLRAVVRPAEPVPVDVFDVGDHADPDAAADRLVAERTVEPFDLASGRLMRAALIRLRPDEHLLVLTFHHIAVDGWSLNVVLAELGELYQAAAEGRAHRLPALPVTYADYTRWQRSGLEGEALERQLAYWRDTLAGAPGVTELPTDHPRPAIESHRGGRCTLALGADLVEPLRERARSLGATLFMTLVAGFVALLRRYTGQDDVVVGTAVSGRTRTELEGLVGYISNTLVLRTDTSGDPTFAQLVARVRETAVSAYAHQDVPFEKLVEALRPDRDLSRHPLFQVMINVPPESTAEPRLGDARLTPVALPDAAARFDLNVLVTTNAGGLDLTIDYAADLFDATTVERMARHFGSIVEAAVAQPGAPLSALSMLTAPERRELEEQNATAAPFPHRCLHQLFEEHAARTPDAVAVESESGQLTYAELDARANRLANHLQRQGATRGSLVGLLLERSHLTMVAILGILKAGAAYVPLDPTYPPERLAYMLDDAGVAVVVTEDQFAGLVPGGTAPVVRLDADRDDIGRERPDRPSPDVRPADLAYVIYTSGSTGRPKGVEVEHRSVVNLLTFMGERLDVTSVDTVLGVTTPAFDLSVPDLFLPLVVGARLVIAAREVAVDGARLAQLMAARGVTFMQATPSTWRMLIDARWPGSPRLTIATGGEATPRGLADELLARSRAVWNMYGPTEATVWCSVDPVVAESGPVPIGGPIANTQLHVLDADRLPVPLGVEGELYVGGAGLARGYHNRAQLTAERFVTVGGERLYRTGDVVARRPDGRFDFRGRVDHQVKLRGHRIELGEVETVLAAHPGVQEAVVVAREDVAGDRRLVAYVVASATPWPTEAELAAPLRAILPAYMVPSAFVVLAALPLTPNGKVDRKALPAPERAAGPAFIEPRTPTEVRLAALWAALLGTEAVGVDDDFFALGGHSLTATRLIFRVADEWEVALPLRAVFEAPTLEGLARRIEAEAGGGGPALVSLRREPPEGPWTFPASFAQQRMWFLANLEPTSPRYNVTLVRRLRGPVDPGRLASALGELVARHESLRTTFADDGGGLTQVVGRPGPVPFEVADARSEADPAAAALGRVTAEARRCLDLSAGPLLRAGLVRVGDDEWVLWLGSHHIVIDGWSIDVLLRDLAELYGAAGGGQAAPTAAGLQYADYSAWQREALAEGRLEDLAYWRRNLAGAPAVLQLPTDRPRPAIESHRGAKHAHVLPPELADALKSLARDRGATLFMTLLAGFVALLQRYSGQDDVVVGTPTSGRTRAELDGIIGLFVNTLVLRTDASGDPSFAELVDRARLSAMGAYAHAELPFEQLVDELRPDRDLSRNPVFQVMLNLATDAAPVTRLGDIEVGTTLFDPGVARLDLNLTAVNRADGIHLAFEYPTDLFDASTIDRMAHHLTRLLEAAVADPDLPLSALTIMTPAEKDRILVEWNSTDAPSPDECMHHLVEAQARRSPDAPAVSDADGALTYGALDARANQLARHLARVGVGPRTFVGVRLERSTNLAVALLAVLKAGAAYVPIDPSYPPDRCEFMLADAAAAAFITDSRLAEPVAALDCPLVDIDADRDEIARQPATPPGSGVGPDDLAYVIYTSGSTGRPKGVMIEHRKLANLVAWHNRSYDIRPHDRSTLLASVGFDASAWEMWPSLAAGASLWVTPEDIRLSPPELVRWLADTGITVAFLPTPLAEATLDVPWSPEHPLRVLLTGGDRLNRRPSPTLPCRLVNHYGPTECTVVTTAGPVHSAEESDVVPDIGRPIANTRVYVLDQAYQPVPIGVPGELYIGGASVARGYLNRPELTAERFISDPFSPRPHARLYRTGDLVRWRAAGTIEFLGRRDDQVKVRGFRIELGEIEHVMGQHPAVRDVVVTVRDDPGEARRLAAYVVADQVERHELLAFLRQTLPPYMVPATITFLEALPLTAHGKVDRQALARPERTVDSPPVAPRTPIESILAEIWEEVLDTKHIGVHDDFFDVGGDSLSATRVVSQLRASVGLELPLVCMFETPTIAELAEGLVERMAAESADGDLEAGADGGEWSGL